MDDDVAARAVTMLGWDTPIVPGDVVYLKSGSPGMTVCTVKDCIVECIWFDKARDRAKDFPEVMLTKQPISADGKARGVLILGELSPETEKH